MSAPATAAAAAETQARQTAAPGKVPQSIAQGEEATRRHIQTGIKAGDIDPSTGSKVLYYHDPMVPGHKFEKPAQPPFMDTEPGPVHAGGGIDHTETAIRARSAIGVA